MEFTGEYLKNIRVARKIKLVTIAEELNISIQTLQDIENDYFVEDTNNVFLIGHIRSYCKFLELDHNSIIENFKTQISYHTSNIKKEISKPIKKISIITIPKTLAVFAASTIAVSFYFLFITNNDLQPNYAMTPDIPENLEYEIEKIEMDVSLSKKIENDFDKLSINEEKIYSDENDIFINNSSAVASLPKVKLENFDTMITLNFINPTWIQIRNKKQEIVVSKLMKIGEDYSYNINDNYSLTAGNAGNIIIAVGGEVKGKAGKPGEVIDSLIIDNQFNN